MHASLLSVFSTITLTRLVTVCALSGTLDPFASGILGLFVFYLVI